MKLKKLSILALSLTVGLLGTVKFTHAQTPFGQLMQHGMAAPGWLVAEQSKSKQPLDQNRQPSSDIRAPAETFPNGYATWPNAQPMPASLAFYPGGPGLIAGGTAISPTSFSNGLPTCSSCDGANGRRCSGCTQCQRKGLLGNTGICGNPDCCRPRWFDIYVGAVFLERDEVSYHKQFTQRGRTLPTDDDLTRDSSDILSMDNLDFDGREPGMRITASHLIGPGSHLELSYLGLLHWEDSAVIRDENHNLYSVFSQYGTLPGLRLPLLGPGLLQTDQATEHTIDYSSDFNSAEMNLRKRWVTPKCRLHYSFLLGVRYVCVAEDFRHHTNVLAHDDPFTGDPLADPADPLFNNPYERGPASLSYVIDTQNDLVGFQIGSDVFACVFPGLMLGADAKAGIYGNHTQQDTLIKYTGGEVWERRSDEDVSAVLEANLQCVWRMGRHVTLRTGYTVMHIQNVALAPEQFDGTPPDVLFPDSRINRAPPINSHGKLSYFGYLSGIEWTW